MPTKYYFLRSKVLLSCQVSQTFLGAPATIIADLNRNHHESIGEDTEKGQRHRGILMTGIVKLMHQTPVAEFLQKAVANTVVGFVVFASSHIAQV